MAARDADTLIARDLGCRALPVVYCAPVSQSARCVSTIVRPTPTSVSDNVRQKPAFIAPVCLSLRAATRYSIARRTLRAAAASQGNYA
jgi:hypothetical protein